jgi:hypothetical protein
MGKIPMALPIPTWPSTLFLVCCLLSGAFPASSPLRAQELPPQPVRQWRLTRSLPAPEAHQAAAADKRHAYAITNDKIARYDRETGKRADVSTAGDLAVKHLNSGFFHEAKLYCAHSNFPLLPEKSSILVLDPATMRIDQFHDFGNFGGSLTWCVFHEERWWCNFARYGTNNHETFLVQFDDGWKERARWTYPTEVVKKLGTASISGGLWHDGALLVTDHDHRRLYRLRLPEKGSVLELVGEEPAPFTGQGIAHDPATGGLIGIDRAKKQLLFAE